MTCVHSPDEASPNMLVKQDADEDSRAGPQSTVSKLVLRVSDILSVGPVMAAIAMFANCCISLSTLAAS